MNKLDVSKQAIIKLYRDDGVSKDFYEGYTSDDIREFVQDRKCRIELYNQVTGELDIPSPLNQELKIDSIVGRARKLAQLKEDYIKLLEDEIKDIAMFLSVHGWKSKRYEEGERLRRAIKSLELDI